MKSEIEIPAADRLIAKEIINKINEAETAYVSWHARPDGDALGGGLALYEFLKSKKIDTRLVSPTPPPENYSFLKNYEKIKTEISDEKRDIGIIIDCSDTYRLEGVSQILEHSGFVISIDHHQLNHEFGDLNYIRPHASSVCELILNLMMESQYPINKDVASSIYVGIITDTNRFQEQNTTSRAHKIASFLVEKYVSPVKISMQIYGNEELKKLKLISKAIESLKLSPSGKVSYIAVRPEMIRETGTNDDNLEGIINYARNIKGVEVGLLLRRIPGLRGIKVSFRSKGKIDVGKIADRYGGGGHHNAAGCLVEGGFDEVAEKIIKVIEDEFKKFKN